MVVEMSVSDARAKRRVLVMLQGLGYDAVSGAVRIAHPFSVEVRGVQPGDRATLRRLVASVDPGATSVTAAPGLAA